MENAVNHLPAVGAVVIGRNEGARLLASIASLLSAGVAPDSVVYVDSGSHDGSPGSAREMGVRVIELDLRTPFTAARARNAGLEHLLGAVPDIRFVQFVDGDCEVVPGWIARAVGELEQRELVAVVCGRRRERFPERSRYNQLCDIEWNTPVGEADACGGDSLMRASALREVGGFNPSIIAGEEPELCARLRLLGQKTIRLDAEMTLHDAAMTRFGQWWKRMKRAGHAYAEIASLHGKPPLRFWVRENRSNWAWGLILPLVAAAAAWPTRGWSLLLVPVAYGVLWLKVRSRAARSMQLRSATLYASFTTLAKVPLALGQMRYWIGRMLGRRSAIIEYKCARAGVSPKPRGALS